MEETSEAAKAAAVSLRRQRFTLTCGREGCFSIAVSLFPRASIDYWQ